MATRESWFRFWIPYGALALLLFGIVGFLYFRTVPAPSAFEGVIIAKHAYRLESLYRTGRIRGYVIVQLESGQTFPIRVPSNLFRDARVGMVLRRNGETGELDMFDRPKGGALLAQ